MKDFPFYRMWVKDFDTDENVRLLNLHEAGLYLFCLNHAWINNGLPAAQEDIARALKVPVNTFRKLWVRVGCCFIQSSDGRFRNTRQEEERAHAIEKSLQASNAVSVREQIRAGSIIGRSSDDESGDHPRARARAVSVSDSSCSSSLEPSNKKEATTRANPLLALGWLGGWKWVKNASDEMCKKIWELRDRDFEHSDDLNSPYWIWSRIDWLEEFWMCYWLLKEKKRARELYFKLVLTLDMHDKIMAAVEAQTAEMMARPEDKRPHATTWLNGARWEDKAASGPDEGFSLESIQ